MRRTTFEQTLRHPSGDFTPGQSPVLGVSTNNELLGGFTFGGNAKSEIYYKILIASTDPDQPDVVEDTLPYEHEANVDRRDSMCLVGPKLASLSFSAIQAAESLRVMEARAAEIRNEVEPELVLAFGEEWEKNAEAQAYIDALTRMEVNDVISDIGFTLSGVTFHTRDFYAL